MCGSEVVMVPWERAGPSSRKSQPEASNTGDGVVGRRAPGKILLSMGALLKDPGPPMLGTWVSGPSNH
jgi:hypothetical protein